MSEIEKRKVVSTPAYAGRSTVGAAAGIWVAARYAAWMPDVEAPEIAAVASITTAVVALLWKAVRDRLHTRSSLPIVGLVIVMLLGVGCRSTSTITMVPQNDTDPTVILEQGASGRNCIATRYDTKSGVIDFVIDMAGESDWGSLRAVTKILPDMTTAATSIFAGQPTGLDSMSDGDLKGPAGFAGCAVIFVDGDDEEDEEAPRYMLVPADDD